MNHNTLIRQTTRLAQAVNKVLIAVGCVHRLRGDADGRQTIPVPIEHVRYDSERGWLWVEIALSRLPRRHTLDTLLAAGLREKVAALVGRPVVLALHGSVIVIATRLA
jgi:hypothetical protein